MPSGTAAGPRRPGVAGARRGRTSPWGVGRDARPARAGGGRRARRSRALRAREPRAARRGGPAGDGLALGGRGGRRRRRRGGVARPRRRAGRAQAGRRGPRPQDRGRRRGAGPGGRAGRAGRRRVARARPAASAGSPFRGCLVEPMAAARRGAHRRRPPRRRVRARGARRAGRDPRRGARRRGGGPRAGAGARGPPAPGAAAWGAGPARRRAAGRASTSTRSRRWSPRSAGCSSTTRDRRDRPQPGDRLAGRARSRWTRCSSWSPPTASTAARQAGRAFVALGLLRARPTAGGRRARLALDLPGLPARMRLADHLRPAGPRRPPGLADRRCRRRRGRRRCRCPRPARRRPSPSSPTYGASGWSSPQNQGGPASSARTVAVDRQRVLGRAVLAGARPDAAGQLDGARPGGPPATGRAARPCRPAGRGRDLVLRALARLLGRVRGGGRVRILVGARRDAPAGRGGRRARSRAPARRRRRPRSAAAAMASLGRRGRVGMAGVCAPPGAGSTPGRASAGARVVPGRTTLLPVRLLDARSALEARGSPSSSAWPQRPRTATARWPPVDDGANRAASIRGPSARDGEPVVGPVEALAAGTGDVGWHRLRDPSSMDRSAARLTGSLSPAPTACRADVDRRRAALPLAHDRGSPRAHPPGPGRHHPDQRRRHRQRRQQRAGRRRRRGRRDPPRGRPGDHGGPAPALRLRPDLPDGQRRRVSAPGCWTRRG